MSPRVLWLQVQCLLWSCLEVSTQVFLPVPGAASPGEYLVSTLSCPLFPSFSAHFISMEGGGLELGMLRVLQRLDGDAQFKSVAPVSPWVELSYIRILVVTPINILHIVHKIVEYFCKLWILLLSCFYHLRRSVIPLVWIVDSIFDCYDHGTRIMQLTGCHG